MHSFHQRRNSSSTGFQIDIVSLVCLISFLVHWTKDGSLWHILELLNLRLNNKCKVFSNFWPDKKEPAHNLLAISMNLSLICKWNIKKRAIKGLKGFKKFVHLYILALLMQWDSFQYNRNSNDTIILLLVSVARLKDDASQITTQLDFFFRQWMLIDIYQFFTDKIHYSRNTWISLCYAYCIFQFKRVVLETIKI